MWEKMRKESGVGRGGSKCGWVATCTRGWRGVSLSQCPGRLHRGCDGRSVEMMEWSWVTYLDEYDLGWKRTNLSLLPDAVSSASWHVAMVTPSTKCFGYIDLQPRLFQFQLEKKGHGGIGVMRQCWWKWPLPALRVAAALPSWKWRSLPVRRCTQLGPGRVLVPSGSQFFLAGRPLEGRPLPCLETLSPTPQKPPPTIDSPSMTGREELKWTCSGHLFDSRDSAQGAEGLGQGVRHLAVAADTEPGGEIRCRCEPWKSLPPVRSVFCTLLFYLFYVLRASSGWRAYWVRSKMGATPQIRQQFLWCKELLNFAEVGKFVKGWKRGKSRTV